MTGVRPSPSINFLRFALVRNERDEWLRNLPHRQIQPEAPFRTPLCLIGRSRAWSDSANCEENTS
jgi:hypothetical protein